MKEALQPDARAKLRLAASGEAAQREVEPPEEFDALMAGSADPWEDEMSQVLQRALEETMTMTMTRAAASSASLRHGTLAHEAPLQHQ